jgi:GTP-binding protein
VDSEEWLAHGYEMAALRLRRAALRLRDERLPDARTARDDVRAPPGAARASGSTDDKPVEPEISVAIVGKRNAGKSTLINTLAGEERVIVSEIAGTTRDSVDVRFQFEGVRSCAIDTAGMRKRKSFADDIEFYAYHRMLHAIRRADVVLLLLDAAEEVSQVDKKLAQELQRQFKPTVIVVNKATNSIADSISPEDYLEYLTEQLGGLEYAPDRLHQRQGRRRARRPRRHGVQPPRAGLPPRIDRPLNTLIERHPPEARAVSPRLGTQARSCTTPARSAVESRRRSCSW